MPFTPAHAAIVLPFLKIPPRYVSGTGLVIGAVAPDFEYFFKMGVDSIVSHTIAGMFYFDLPVVVLLSVLFHLVVKKNLIGNLPVSLQVKFGSLRRLNFASYMREYPVAFVFSALAGTATHIFWDGFTHGDGYFVNRLSFYEGTIIPFDGARYPLWYALQHISTAVGLCAIFVYLVMKKADDHRADVQRPNVLYWVQVFACTLLVVGLRFLVKSSDYNFGNFVVTTISGFCIGLVVFGALRRTEKTKEV